MIAGKVLLLGIATLSSVITETIQTDTETPPSPLCKYLQKDGEFKKGPEYMNFVIAGSHLKSQDRRSEADAFVKVYVLRNDFNSSSVSDGKSMEKRCDKTEAIKNSADPHWNNVFTFKKDPDNKYSLHFVVRDHDVLAPDDDMGWASLDINEYVRDNEYANLSITDGGYLIVQKAEPVHFRLYARNLPRTDNFNGRSDAYVKAYWRYGKDGANNPLGRSSVIDNDDNPNWKDKFTFAHFKSGTDQYVFFQLFDSDTISQKDFIGELLVAADLVFSDKSYKTFNLTSSRDGATLSVIPIVENVDSESVLSNPMPPA